MQKENISNMEKVDKIFKSYKDIPGVRFSGHEKNEWSNLDDLREEAAVKAFELRDWLIACECGGLKAEPRVQSHEAAHFDEYSIVKISYTLSSLCGCSDSLYHTGYKETDIYSDIYKVDNNANITCLAGEEGKNSIGAEDVFHVLTETIISINPVELKTSFENIPDDHGHVLKFKDKYSGLIKTELDNLIKMEENYER